MFLKYVQSSTIRKAIFHITWGTDDVVPEHNVNWFFFTASLKWSAF